MKYYKNTTIVIILIGLLLQLFAVNVNAAPSTNMELSQALAGLGAKSRKKIIKSVKKLGQIGDPAAIPALEALQERKLRADANGRIYIINDDGTSAKEALTGETYTGAIDDLYTPIINNRVRRVIKTVLARLKLRSSDPEVRLLAAKQLAKNPREDASKEIQTALEKETNDEIREALALALALTQIDSPRKDQRLQAIKTIAESGNLKFIPLLKGVLAKDSTGNFIEPDAEVRKAASKAIKTIERHMLLISTIRNLFYGLSLGSVLLLAALGLAITFGLMGVINMAHGEMLMLGAYSTYVIQELFKNFLPGLFEWYIIASIPVAFIVPAVVGMILERTIIRHLYGRPLETLLATWGISLMLIQTVRLIFGAQNVEVSNPSWLSGGFQITQGLLLTNNRISIILFAVFVVFLVWLLLNRTPLGLMVRAVTQSRSTASAMGILTSRIDMWTFGLGSGIAGLGGLALSQIGNVGPELGQSYIVDSFMVVVLGGVGKIAGTIFGAFGLGIINKFLEPFTGAVLGKIFVLVFIILFIQKRPQGIFALKGRLADG
ncbi:urea ABC transporter permease subunit UrtB [Desulfohalobiaceae bacterium Ax17]|uniref:urea ABC transporter permease subunit UrtB n=1 Tax=Desulfovulcanus ferrireducens TaxID=2831190 RepID=UPI00207BAC98|nr:urea ABC transporter permease subunit UrtB [Desulfovulcanus ferrireducens]MBT8764323.1 urea ABC transporter permease subunit UrtB [Desulfovulcanus ferrireducens]